MLLHLMVWFAGRPEAVHAGAGGPHVCHADGPQGGGACHSQSSSQGQHLHGTTPTLAMIAMQAYALCLDTRTYSSMFAFVGRQTLHAYHSEVIEVPSHNAQHMQAACSDSAPL